MIDDKWKKISQFVKKRDSYNCSLLIKLSKKEQKELKKNAGRFIRELDSAHIFRKSRYPHIKYNPEFIIILNRYSHSMLDSNKDPITGKSISKEEVKEWWIFIVGEKKYNKLYNMLEKRKTNE